MITAREVKERPILFSAAMICALLEGRKTQTRRLVKRQPHESCGPIEVGWYNPTVIDRHGDEQPGPETFGAYSLDGEWGMRCPYGAPGDRLWVREAWTADFRWPTGDGIGHEVRSWVDMPAAFRGPKAARSVYYRAEPMECHPPHEFGDPAIPRADQPSAEEWDAVRWRPSIHMPRWASRLTLTITEVRVERVQDITEADAIAEGFEAHLSGEYEVTPDASRPARENFLRLFYDLNRRAPVDENPWVWALTFRRLEEPQS